MALGEKGRKEENREEKAENKRKPQGEDTFRGRDLASAPVQGVNSQTSLCLSLFSWACSRGKSYSGTRGHWEDLGV